MCLKRKWVHAVLVQSLPDGNVVFTFGTLLGQPLVDGYSPLSSLSLLVKVQVRVMLRISVSLAMSGGKGG
jgi:hypothetical protein